MVANEHGNKQQNRNWRQIKFEIALRGGGGGPLIKLEEKKIFRVSLLFGYFLFKKKTVLIVATAAAVLFLNWI